MVEKSRPAKKETVGVGADITRLTAVLLLAILAAGALFVWWVVEQADSDMRADLLQQARLVAQAVNIENVRALSGTKADLESPDYRRLKEQFTAIRSANPQCRFAYLLGRKADGAVFFFLDSEPAGSEDYSPPGQVFEEISEACLRVFDTRAEDVEGPVADQWGTWVSALVPISDTDYKGTGGLLAVLGIDIDASTWNANVAARAALPVGLMLMLLIGAAAVFVYTRHTETGIRARQAELRKSEEKYRLLADYHKRLNDISIAISEASSTEDLFDRIAEMFRFLTGAIASSFSVYGPETRELKLVSVSADPISRDKAALIFGPGSFEMRTPVSPDAMEIMLRQVIKRPKDLHELSFGTVRPDLSDTIMEAIECRQIVALAISYAGKLYGTCIAYLSADQPVPLDGALITYSHIAGLALMHRATEQQVQKSEAQYRLLSEHMTDVVWLMDMDFNTLYNSPSVEKLRGFTLKEITEMPAEENLTPASLKLAYEVFLEELSKMQADPGYQLERTLEVEMYRKNGTTFWAETKFGLIRDEHTKPVSILCEARDITERKKAEDALRDSEEKYRVVVENALEAIFIAVDGIIRFANGRAVILSGYSQEELIGKPFIDFIHPNERQMVAERYIKWLKGEEVPTTDTLRFILKQGAIRWGEISVVPIIWEGMAATLSFLTDVTDRRHLDEERQRVEKLESVGVLAGGIAHDFNNILTSVLGNISLASMEAPDGGELQGSLKEAQKAVLRAKDLTKQLLTFSKGGAPVTKLASLTELIKDTASFALRGSNVKCRFSIPADLWHAEIDEGQVSQVIQNLVLNAQQAMPAGGIIDISAENIALSETQDSGKGLPLNAGNYVRIAVADHGTGIPAEQLDRIFDPFFTTKQTGSGLGLATSFSIARNHGGHLSVESEVVSGSTFYLYLPASTQTVTPKQDKTVASKHIGKARILVMDDEKGVREIAGRMLNHIGYKDVEFATDGAEAIKLYKAAMESGNPFTVTILDLTIAGGMGGKETVKKLLKIDPEVKAIVSSGYIDDSVIARHREYGFSGMVAKPYTLTELRKAVQHVIGAD